MIKREIEVKFKRLSNSRKVILITGSRQVGKSTFVKNLKEEDRTYVTLDDLSLRELAQNDPKLFLMNYPGKIIIDEVQYAPNLFPYIKMDVDETGEYGKYWLTGSQRFELLNNVSESLAGRVSILEMSTLSYAEKEGFESKLFNPTDIHNNIKIDPNNIFENIFRGGMPEYICNAIDRNQFFDDYVRTYLERDVRQLTQVGDLMRFRKFMIAVASRNGEVLNYSSLSEDADIDVNTVKRWLAVLEANDIVYLLKPYSNNKLKRAIKSPKVYFLDTGLCSFLSGWNSKEALESSAMAGHFLKSFVISELVKNKRNNKETLNYDFYYYRDRDQKEIDLIIELDNIIYPFEIKKTANPSLSMIKNFSVLNNNGLKVGNGGLLCFYPDIIPLDEHNKSYPLTVIF